MALNSSVIPAAIYKGLYAPWNLKQYQLLDVPISALLRKITKNTAYYPTALLYSPKSEGCHGFTRLSTKIMEQKQQLLHTALEGNPATARAMKSILHRALNYNGCPPTYNQSATIHSIHDEGWLSSLVQMHAQLDQYIALGGTALANSLDQLILDEHNLGALFNKNERKDIISAGVITVGDLTTTDEQGRITWTRTNRLPTPCLDKITSSYDPPQGTMTLRAGQCFLIAHED